MKNPKNMTEEELDIAIKEKYGEQWEPSDLDKNDPLSKEYWDRIARGR